jgi:hypothetical protein
MTQLFLIHSEQDDTCAAQLQHDLTAQGYTIGQGSDWQQGIKESGAVVVVWSAAAAQAARVTEQIERAQWLHKRLVVVATDSTALPDALARVQIVHSIAPCTDAAAQLLPHLPPATAGDTLLHDLLTNPPDASAPPQPALTRSDAAHIFGVRCEKGHVTYFDKREVCREDGSITRSIVYRDDRQLDALRLRCGTAGCGEWVWVDVDCEGYK